MIKWPSELIEDLARRKAVLFLGAGVSANSTGDNGKRPPSWEQFLLTCLDKCEDGKDTIRSFLESKDYLTACELLKVRLADQWYEILANEFSRPRYKPADIHKSLFQLDCRLVLTQNFDKIFDVYTLNETQGDTVVKNYYDDDTPLVMRRNYRAVIKVHGSIDEPSKTIFTRGDYAQVRHRYRGFQNLIDALFLTHTFVFLGCGLNDPDLRLFLEQHAHNQPSAPVHYMASPEGEISSELDVSIKDNMNIRLLRYSDASGHQELTDSVKELVELVEEKREDIADRQDW